MGGSIARSYSKLPYSLNGTNAKKHSKTETNLKNVQIGSKTSLKNDLNLTINQNSAEDQSNANNLEEENTLGL